MSIGNDGPIEELPLALSRASPASLRLFVFPATLELDQSKHAHHLRHRPNEGNDKGDNEDLDAAFDSNTCHGAVFLKC